MVRAVLSILRRPRVIVGEIVVIGLMATLGTLIPQVDSMPVAGSTGFQSREWLLTPLFKILGLDHVFRSGWFAAATALAAASLLLAVTDQFRRLRTAWTRPLTEKDFANATYQAEFERPARGGKSGIGAVGTTVLLRTEKRLGLAGPAVFHLGLLFVVLAGALQALFGVHAVVDVMEGETLPATAEAWGAQWPGIWARPFELQDPVTLDNLHYTYYEKGDLRDFRARFSLKRGTNVQSGEMAVNHDLLIPGGRLYLGSDFGPVPLLEWRRDEHPPVREAPLLKAKEKSMYEGTAHASGDIRAYLRARIPGTGERPDRLDVRVMKGPGLLFAGTVPVGATVKVAESLELRLHDMPFWCRLHGSRDPGLWIAYLGFTLIVIGATIMFGIIKVDTCVTVQPSGQTERVRVALKAQRFGPLFEDAFQRRVRDEGGPS